PAYKWVSTLMRLPSRPTGTMLTQIVEVNPLELAAALERDAQPAETTPQPTRGGGVVRRNSTANRMGAIREGWQYWVTLNANDLTWTALVIGGVLFTSWLMRGRAMSKVPAEMLASSGFEITPRWVADLLFTEGPRI